MDEHTSFFALLLVVFLAFAVPLIISRFRGLRLPVVVGEIVAGVLGGRSGLGWVPAQFQVVLLQGLGRFNGVSI